MQHRIVVLGAGYAGATAAGHLARSLRSDDVEITVVNAEPNFVERPRLHQLAAGQDLDPIPLSRVFDGTGIRLRVAYVSAIDPEARTVQTVPAVRTVRTRGPAGHPYEQVGQVEQDQPGASDTETLPYDTLLYTLGSRIDSSVPGVREYAFDLATRPSAQRLRERLEQLDAPAKRGQARQPGQGGQGCGRVLVVGGNLTAIEAATEIAEYRPGLNVGLVTAGELGGWLGPKARQHLLHAFERFGIDLHEHATVERVEQGELVTTGGGTFAADVIVWAAGFAVDPLAAASGLAVQETGRVLVDDRMRSISHPSVYAAGDSAYVIGENGQPLPMSCASAGFSRMRAAAAIIRDLTGRSGPRTPLTYIGNAISLGQRNGIFQTVSGDGRSRSWALTGGVAAWVKRSVLNGAAWSIRNPTLGVPIRRRRLAPAFAPATEKVAA